VANSSSIAARRPPHAPGAGIQLDAICTDLGRLLQQWVARIDEQADPAAHRLQFGDQWSQALGIRSKSKPWSEVIWPSPSGTSVACAGRVCSHSGSSPGSPRAAARTDCLRC
jgi:hypothetical protein